LRVLRINVSKSNVRKYTENCALKISAHQDLSQRIFQDTEPGKGFKDSHLALVVLLLPSVKRSTHTVQEALNLNDRSADVRIHSREVGICSIDKLLVSPNPAYPSVLLKHFKVRKFARGRGFPGHCCLDDVPDRTLEDDYNGHCSAVYVTYALKRST
jgi:hypothetical protein